ncbi:MAG: hypothetical protein PHR77_20530, partial [Kiritimatiellae bacterium]|nr:hypothetical protein [Kiritimatiellia bacterium]
WDGTQEWYLSKTRLAGLVALEATTNETAAAVHGRIRLGLSRTLESSDNQIWKYSRLRIKIHAHNYARIDTRPSETFFLDKPEKYRSTEITLLDPLSAGVDQKEKVNYPKGTKYWFLVEIYPDSSEPAVELRRIEEGQLTGLLLKESGRQVLVIHNPTDTPVNANLSRLISGNAAMLYEDASGNGKSAEPLPAEYSLGPQRHIVIVAKP